MQDKGHRFREGWRIVTDMVLCHKEVSTIYKPILQIRMMNTESLMYLSKVTWLEIGVPRTSAISDNSLPFHFLALA